MCSALASVVGISNTEYSCEGEREGRATRQRKVTNLDKLVAETSDVVEQFVNRMWALASPRQSRPTFPELTAHDSRLLQASSYVEATCVYTRVLLEVLTLHLRSFSFF